LHFSDEINNYNSQSLNIRQALAEILCHNIAQVSVYKDINTEKLYIYIMCSLTTE